MRAHRDRKARPRAVFAVQIGAAPKLERITDVEAERAKRIAVTTVEDKAVINDDGRDRIADHPAQTEAGSVAHLVDEHLFEEARAVVVRWLVGDDAACVDEDGGKDADAVPDGETEFGVEVEECLTACSSRCLGRGC